MNLAELEKRIARMEDIEAIKQLKARYCEICDDNHNPDRIASVFAPDGIWEGAGFGKAQGHEGIRELFRGFQKLISFSQHNVMNPIIEIDGDRATGVWYFLGPFTGADLAAPFLRDGILLLAQLHLVQPGAKHLHGLLPVLDLRLLILLRNHHAGGQVRDAHRGVRGVDALAAGAAGTERVDAEVFRFDLDVHFLGFRQHGDCGC